MQQRTGNSWGKVNATYLAVIGEGDDKVLSGVALANKLRDVHDPSSNEVAARGEVPIKPAEQRTVVIKKQRRGRKGSKQQENRHGKSSDSGRVRLDIQQKRGARREGVGQDVVRVKLRSELHIDASKLHWSGFSGTPVLSP